MAANVEGRGTGKRKAGITEKVKSLDIPADIKRGYLSETNLYFGSW